MGMYIVADCSETGTTVVLGYNESFVSKRTKKEGGNKRIYFNDPMYSRIKKNPFFINYRSVDDVSMFCTTDEYKEKTNVISKA